MQSRPKSSPDQEIIKAFEAGGVIDYLQYLQSGKRIMWINFKAGVAKGFGITFGMTVVLGMVIWILTMLINLPVLGEYFADAQQYVTEYADSTNYEDEFKEMIQLLGEINENKSAVVNSETPVQN